MKALGWEYILTGHDILFILKNQLLPKDIVVYRKTSRNLKKKKQENYREKIREQTPSTPTLIKIGTDKASYHIIYMATISPS